MLLIPERQGLSTQIQIAHLLGHSSEKGLKNVITGTGKSMGSSGCKLGGAGLPLSAAGGCHIGTELDHCKARWVEQRLSFAFWGPNFQLRCRGIVLPQHMTLAAA